MAAVSRDGVLLESDKQSEERWTWRVQDGAKDQKRETTDREEK